MVNVRLDGPVEKKTDEDATAKPQPKLPGTSPEISEFQLGVVVNRSVGVTGSGRAAPMPENVSVVDSALHITNANQPKSASDVRLTSAQQPAQPVDVPAATADDEAKIQHFEQMLRQLKQKQRQKSKLPIVEKPAPVKLPKQKRFRLSPTTSNGVPNNRDVAKSLTPQAETTVHPLDELPARSPHPLEGF
jgi:hypothetical protein